MVVHMVLILVPGHVFKFIKFQELLKLRPCCQWRGPRAFRIHKADTRRQAATLSDPADLAVVGLVSHIPDVRIQLKFRRLEGALTLMIV
jgi:hypothetical protein